MLKSKQAAGQRTTRGAVAAAAALTLVALVGPPASAAPDFYAPPFPLASGAAGDLIRTEPAALAVRLPNATGGFPADATRIMYRSADANDAPIAVTGTYLNPQTPWTGTGARPLVSLAVGTHGQGDQCAPSKLLGQLVSMEPGHGPMPEYELLAINALLLQGIAVVVTDYEGLGTPGVHTYVNRAAEAHAVLDAARAVQRLPGTAITPHGPVGFWGYSQGGGAAAAAAELASSYAPELDVKGTYAGAPPADLAATLAQIDGSSLVGAIGYAINSLLQAYPELHETVDAQINDRGRAMLAEVANQCVTETAAAFGFQKTSDYTRSGEPLGVVLARLPLANELIDRQRIGRLTPSAPVLVQSGVRDDVVPFGQARELAADWCGRGATVQFTENPLPALAPGLGVNHAAPMVLGLPEATSFVLDRFNGRPVTGNCAG
ncbi:lipase family protein [Rhodococcus sp. NPDC059234]|uniref:lipase family protein n=1 Tax=Rhodococcus sp. NPDC059234 TaxID=3346781 RepID=UPI00366C5A26